MNVLRFALALAAIIAWVASVSTFLIAGKPVDPWVHMMFAAVATALFGPEIWKRRNGKGNGP